MSGCCVQGNADDWLWKEIRGEKITIFGNPGSYVGRYRGKSAALRGVRD